VRGRAHSLRERTRGLVRVVRPLNSDVRSRMIFLVLSKGGYAQIEELVSQPGTVIWVSDGVLSNSDLAAIRGRGAQVTNFSRRIEPRGADIAEALETIAEHHPRQPVWVEHVPDF